MLTDEQVQEIRYSWEHGGHSEDVPDLCDTIDALRAKLREAQIKARKYVTPYSCRWCLENAHEHDFGLWPIGTPERHAPGCIAAPKWIEEG